MDTAREGARSCSEGDEGVAGEEEAVPARLVDAGHAELLAEAGHGPRATGPCARRRRAWPRCPDPGSCRSCRPGAPSAAVSSSRPMSVGPPPTDTGGRRSAAAALGHVARHDDARAPAGAARDVAASGSGRQRPRRTAGALEALLRLLEREHRIIRCPASNVAARWASPLVVGVASSGVLCEAGSTGGSTQTVTVAAGSGSATPQAVRPTSERAAAATASRIRKRRRWRGVRPVMSVECATAGRAATRRLRAVTYA